MLWLLSHPSEAHARDSRQRSFIGYWDSRKAVHAVLRRLVIIVRGLTRTDDLGY